MEGTLWVSYALAALVTAIGVGNARRRALRLRCRVEARRLARLVAGAHLLGAFPVGLLAGAFVVFTGRTDWGAVSFTSTFAHMVLAIPVWAVVGLAAMSFEMERRQRFPSACDECGYDARGRRRCPECGSERWPALSGDSTQRSTIEPLAHTTPDIAHKIHAVMTAAYAVEAEILGVSDFAPLRRSAEHIASSSSAFIGVRDDDVYERPLIAVAEIEADERGGTNIAALVTAPTHFRRGHATRLLGWIIDHCDRPLTVSTGAANAPALQLYERFEFVESHRWTTECGIPMVTLARSL
ncbi:MAG: GNAT family N-acetyltransferase [Phycisphaerales bacterium]|nr:GNAT family N-acetyltransferase [Phycisphaerales bacterium]